MRQQLADDENDEDDDEDDEDELLRKFSLNSFASPFLGYASTD